MGLVIEHYSTTKDFIERINKLEIAKWLLEEGYFPEQNILPPCFTVEQFSLESEPIVTKLAKGGKQFNKFIKLKSVRGQFVTYPKTFLTDREFGFIDPRYYHDLVYWMINSWEVVLDKVFPKDQKIFSYSFPIPIKLNGVSGVKRAGRMVYEWIEMAEKDLIAESINYKFLIKTDVSNFYPSIYTHSIAWAFHGKDRGFEHLGNKVDRLVQSSNDGKTNGLIIGSALFDLIAEIILARIDLNFSKNEKITDIDFLAVRFKDDYRILCNSKDEATRILKILSKELNEYHLNLNDKKTNIFELPDGLYREHIIQFSKIPLNYKSKQEKTTLKDFEISYIQLLRIHEENPGTSIIEKFLSQLWDKEHNLKVTFSGFKSERQVQRFISILLMIEKKSPKSLPHILAIIEFLRGKYNKHNIDQYLSPKLKKMITEADEKSEIFSLAWLIYFIKREKIKYLGRLEDDIKYNNENLIIQSILEDKQKYFTDQKNIKIFKSISQTRDTTLRQHLDLFSKNNSGDFEE